MATAAFKSTTTRSTSTLRRSRSLSRLPKDSSSSFTSSGSSVNKPFPEISLDDLADEFFERSKHEEEQKRLDRRDYVSPRKGRSVSRQRKGSLVNNVGSRGSSGSRGRRQRSASVAKYRCSDSESHSSAITDEEAVRRGGGTTEKKTIRAVYAQRKMEHPSGDGEGNVLYEAMRREVRRAIEDIRTGLEKVTVKTETTGRGSVDDSVSNGANVTEAVEQIRRNYVTKLEQSEKRRKDLLAELAVEEQHGQELSKIVRELLPALKAPKQSSVLERPSRCKKRNSTISRIPRHLTEDADKCIEDFLSNVDADVSSYDGERSDTSSTLGGSIKLKDSRLHCTIAENSGSPTKADALTPETEGVALPWLQWETSPSLCKTKKVGLVDSRNGLFGSLLGKFSAEDSSYQSAISQWSPEGTGSCPLPSRDIRKSKYSVDSSKGPSFEMDEYLHLQYSEDLIFERFRQRQRIESGSLLFCGRTSI